jgi:hypothetical protein
MISKRVKRNKQSSSFKRLGYYILAAKTGSAAILRTPPEEYVVSPQDVDAKVLMYRMTNCAAYEPEIAIQEIMATQAQNTRSQADKTYHLIISFPRGEIPSREQLEDIEDELCNALGFSEHQRLSAVHDDTDNLHLHVAINKVHPTTLKVLEPYRDYAIRDRVCQALEEKHGLRVDKRRGQGQTKPKVHYAPDQQPELQQWVKGRLDVQVKEFLAVSPNWEGLHALLGQYGLLLKPRGAGLSLIVAGSKLSMKASALNPDLSLKRLTERLGAYQPPSQDYCAQSEKSGERYLSPDGKIPNPSPTIGQQYQSAKAQVYQCRDRELNALRQRHQEYRQKLRAYYGERRASIQRNRKLSPKSIRQLNQNLYAAMRDDLEKQKQLEKEQKNQIREQYPIPSWERWLVAQVDQGNLQALALLRKQERTRRSLAQDLLTVDDLAAARDLIFPFLKPQTNRQGDITYRLKDGGVVQDTAGAVHVPQMTEASALLALSLAQERFQGKPLRLEGTVEFKVEIAEQAGRLGLNLHFKDEELEAIRQGHLKRHRSAQGQTLSPEKQQEQAKNNEQGRGM